MICNHLAHTSLRAVVLPIAELQNQLIQRLQLRLFSRLPSIEEANAVCPPPLPPANSVSIPVQHQPHRPTIVQRMGGSRHARAADGEVVLNSCSTGAEQPVWTSPRAHWT